MIHGKNKQKLYQKIDMLLSDSWTLSGRMDKSVNSVAIYELSAICLYGEEREAWQLL